MRLLLHSVLERVKRWDGKVCLKLDVQGQGGGKRLDLDGQGGGWSQKLDNFNVLHMCIVSFVGIVTLNR